MNSFPHPLRLSLIVLAMVFRVGAGLVQAEPNKQESRIGVEVSPFSAPNCYGKPIDVAVDSATRATVIVFLGTECPLAKLYGPRLEKLHARFRDQGVRFLGINANTQDSLTELAAYRHRHQLTFALLKDVGNRIADSMDAKRTPEAFLLDQDFSIRYHGRIDDQYGVGISRNHATKHDLADAIVALLAGRPIETPETLPVGCHIGRAKETAQIGEVTFCRDIAPLLNRHCVQCHRQGEIAPFTLTSYEDVLGWEDTILEVVAENRMPPWFADPSHGRFSNEARLSDLEKDLLKRWVDSGMPEGDPVDLPDPPRFTKGWQIEEPDQVIEMRDRPFKVPAEGVIDYQRFVVDPGWDEDKYIVQAEARPDRRDVVHHILVYVIEPGKRRADLRQIVAGYAPGSPPICLDPGVAIVVKAGSKLLFEMHYTPNGSPQSDLSYVGLVFAEPDTIRKQLRGRLAINQDFRIPPRASAKQVTARYKAQRDELLISLTPHMHLRGKSFRYDATFPDGSTQTLLNVPHYDFNWQLKYELAEPMLIPRGTRVDCTAVFDNSEWNLANPNPDQEVRWGDQSFDEMMIGFMETVSVGDDF